MRGDLADQVQVVANDLAVDLADHVAGANAGDLGRPLIGDLVHQHPEAVVETEPLAGSVIDAFLVHGDADIAALDEPTLTQLLDHPANVIDRQRETDTLGEVGPANRRVDPDHVALGIQQGTARIAEVDRRVGLDEADDAGVRIADWHSAVLGRDDPDRHRLLELERVADGDDPLADAHRVAVAQRQRRQLLAVGVDLQQRQIDRRIGADDLGLVKPPGSHSDANQIGTVDDVVVRQDVTVFGDDEARTLADAGLVLRRTLGIALARLAEEPAPEPVLRRTLFTLGPTLFGLVLTKIGTAHADHRRHRGFNHGGESCAGRAAGDGRGQLHRTTGRRRQGHLRRIQLAAQHHPEDDARADDRQQRQESQRATVHLHCLRLSALGSTSRRLVFPLG